MLIKSQFNANYVEFERVYLVEATSAEVNLYTPEGQFIFAAGLSSTAAAQLAESFVADAEWVKDEAANRWLRRSEIREILLNVGTNVVFAIEGSALTFASVADEAEFDEYVAALAVSV